jgi:hypothetical protein
MAKTLHEARIVLPEDKANEVLDAKKWHGFESD